MLIGGQIAALIAAVFWAILVAFLAFAVAKVGKVLTEAGRLVRGVADETAPLLERAGESLSKDNGELDRVDGITADAKAVTGNVAFLTSLFTLTVGEPAIKAAAATYAVRRALAERRGTHSRAAR
jgi:uncharacterized protein YoxC